MIDPIEYQELGQSTEGKSPTQHEEFTKTIKVNGTVITYKFFGGAFSNRGKENNFSILLATYRHQDTGLEIKLVEKDGLWGATKELAKWCEDQVSKNLSEAFNIEVGLC